MVVIRDSMAEDLKAAREKHARLRAQINAIGVPVITPAPAVRKMEHPSISVSEKKPESVVQDEVAIKDEYAGNASYELFKNRQPDFMKKLAEMETEERASQIEIDSAKREAAMKGKSADKAPEEVKTEPLADVPNMLEARAMKPVEAYREKIEAVPEIVRKEQGAVLASDQADEVSAAVKVPRSGSFSGDIASLKQEVISKLGLKRVLTLVFILLLLFAGGIAALKYKSGLTAKNQVDVNILFPEDLSKVKNDMDATRIKSVNTLAKAVVIYHIEMRTDLPVSETYIKLNEVNPVTDYFKEALKKYGKSEDLLLDPRNPGYYYSYRSVDGQNIEFSAHLEDTGSERCANQDPCLFQVVLTAENIQDIEKYLDSYKKSL
jgi:nitrogen fixation protein FixH